MNTEFVTLSVYFTNLNTGYRWYAGRYNQNTGKPDQEKNSTRYVGTPIKRRAIAVVVSAMIQSPYHVEVEVTPSWHSGFSKGEFVRL